MALYQTIWSFVGLLVIFLFGVFIGSNQLKASLMVYLISAIVTLFILAVMSASESVK